MDINTIIQNALNTIEIENYWLERPSGEVNCIIYNYNEYKGYNSDGLEEGIKYDCYFNYICSLDNIISLRANIKNIKKELELNGFRKVDILSPVGLELDGIKCYQVIFNYKKII